MNNVFHFLMIVFQTLAICVLHLHFDHRGRPFCSLQVEIGNFYVWDLAGNIVILESVFMFVFCPLFPLLSMCFVFSCFWQLNVAHKMAPWRRVWLRES